MNKNKNFNKSQGEELEEELKILTIYFNKEKTRRQVIRPIIEFDEDYSKLVYSLFGNNYDSYEIK